MKKYRIQPYFKTPNQLLFAIVNNKTKEMHSDYTTLMKAREVLRSLNNYRHAYTELVCGQIYYTAEGTINKKDTI